ncbi:MAG: LuxR C-terminal-related transcriptional regulator [Anaerolineales bacterium]
MGSIMRIVVIDSHVLFREGLVSLLLHEPDLDVVGEAKDYDDGVSLCKETRPDLVLMDIKSTQDTELAAIKRIRKHVPDTLVIVLANHESDEMLFAALRSGATGFLLKNSSFVNVLASIKAVERGEAAISRKMTRSLVDEFVRMCGDYYGTQDGEIEKLTPREQDVLKFVSTGATNREIANQLNITESTVKIHVSNILEKLSLRNRREAASYANRHDLGLSMEELKDYQSSSRKKD